MTIPASWGGNPDGPDWPRSTPGNKGKTTRAKKTGAKSGVDDPRAGLVEPKTAAEARRRMKAAAALIQRMGELMLEEEAATAAGGSR